MAVLVSWLLEEFPKDITHCEILEISGYDDLIKNHSKVRNTDIDWNVRVYDWRTQTKRVIELPSSWQFEFNKAKRYIAFKRDKNVPVSYFTR